MMGKKILITGSNGMLASDLSTVANNIGFQVVGYSHNQLDVTNPTQVSQAIHSVKPDIVVNTPGISVDECERYPNNGYLIHSWASGLVARTSEQVGATLIYVSTCGLFGDEVKFYSEYDPVELKTKYARSKFAGENEARVNCHNTYVIRPGWLYGGTPNHQRNFVYQRYLEAKRNSTIKSAIDKYGSPTYTVDLAKCILSLVETEAYGLYHITNEGMASRYEYVQSILQAFDLNTHVEGVDSSEFPRASPVPDCEALANINLKFLGVEQPPIWQEALQRYVNTLKDLI